MHIVLIDGTQLNHKKALLEHKYVNGANRDVLVFEFDETYSVDSLRELFTADNCEVINIVTETEKLLDDGTVEAVLENNYHEGYTIRVEVAERIKEIKPATVSTPAITETRVLVSMAQRTYAETLLAQLQAQNDVLTECILEMSTEVYAK